MDVLLFGATGMVGQGVLRECLQDHGVSLVVTIGRRTTGWSDPKLEEIVHPDLFDYTAVEERLRGLDACFFCLGATAAGKDEAEYARLNYDLPLAAATALARLNPGMTFVYVSGAGTDSSESGKMMWARVKGRTENALLGLPFRAAYMLRPGVIQPMHGERSSTPFYNRLYAVMKPLVPLLRLIFQDRILTTVSMGQAMLALARLPPDEVPQRVLEAQDIAVVARRG